MNKNSTRNKSILIIEDDDISSAFLKLSLSHLLKNEYTVFVADTATKALDLLSQIKPELIILDYYLPDINGLELAKKIKLDCDKSIKTIKIIMLTSLNAEEIKLKQAQYIDEIIFKPADIVTISNTLEKLLTLEITTEHLSLNKSDKQKILHFNRDEFFDKVGHDTDFIASVFEVFFYNFTSTMEQIKNALIKKDADLFFKGIHYLKGETATLCLEVLNNYFNILSKTAFGSTTGIEILLAEINNEYNWLRNNSIPF